MVTFRTFVVHKLVSQRRFKCANETEKKLFSRFGVLSSQSYMGNQSKFFKILRAAEQIFSNISERCKLCGVFEAGIVLLF